MNSSRRVNEHRSIRTRGPRGLVTQAAIRRLAQEVVKKFHPEKIILFGSYAYGWPDRDSDVDLLVVMPAGNEISKASRIYCAVDPSFALDVIVRTPENLRWRVEGGDWFLREIVSKGKTLYDKDDRRVGEKGRSRHKTRQKADKGRPRIH
jgi:predicted nucleotidyltransferase